MLKYSFNRFNYNALATSKPDKNAPLVSSTSFHRIQAMTVLLPQLPSSTGSAFLKCNGLGRLDAAQYWVCQHGRFDARRIRCALPGTPSREFVADWLQVPVEPVAPPLMQGWRVPP